MSAPGASTTASVPAPSRRSRAGLIALLALLWIGSTVLFSIGLWQVAVVEDAEAVEILPQLIAGVMVLGFAPMIGQLEMQRPSGVEPGGRGSPSVRLVVWLSITALAAVVHAIASLVGGVPPLVAGGFVLGALGSCATSWILGQRALLASRARLARRDPSRELVAIDLDWTAEDVRRKWRIIGCVLVGGLSLATVVAFVFPAPDGGAVLTWLGAAQLACLAAGGTSALVGREAIMSGPAITSDLSVADRKVIGRRTIGKESRLEPELEWRAARLAAVFRLGQPFMAAQTGLVALGFVPLLVRAGTEPWMLIVFGSLLAFLVGSAPLIVRQQRRLRRFAEATQELARSYVPMHPGAPTG